MTFPIPIAAPTPNEKLIDNLTHVPSGNVEYRPRGMPKVTRFTSYRNELDAEAEAEGSALQRLERTDSNGVDQWRVRKGHR